MCLGIPTASGLSSTDKLSNHYSLRSGRKEFKFFVFRRVVSFIFRPRKAAKKKNGNSKGLKNKLEFIFQQLFLHGFAIFK
jgi:hypothetical protein